ncbi:hypothetical protein [Mammaliicoccus sciuri]|uniref:hypothetical protein n=1 Tax=Mammaliicoccus sciuri TaxID=1296 RepID=UPI000D1DE302|nr:hypothetical protein [Mammaliicoccus sciuri]MBV5105874.1 hypothetical protein [Mammaliicoccus sciuri]MEB7733822.1 hypothetical protein [Mammaliicoccus sciuri]MRE72857.1 hypothetical protein [Mammaliicoccus sciuri]PTJ70047.1 hypothetical protein BU008_10965 [Mammaliicoccus sciuri]RIO00635.1 hypothetical protein BUZ91_09680 [Mammaliicoccus sciuri]
MKQLIKNRELLTGVFVFILIGICLLLSLFLNLEQILICIAPVLIIFLIFRDWLKGKEEAKKLKHFMLFRLLINIIIFVLMILYIFSSYQSDGSPNILYMLGWCIVIFIGFIIENKYFIKKESSK